MCEGPYGQQGSRLGSRGKLVLRGLELLSQGSQCRRGCRLGKRQAWADQWRYRRVSFSVSPFHGLEGTRRKQQVG